MDESTREFFERWSAPADVASGEGSPTAALEKALKAARLVEGIRSFGYAAARLDPLGSTTLSDPVLEAEFHGLSEEDLEYVPAGLVVGGSEGDRASSAREAVDEVRSVYCGASGYDFAHVRATEERFWLREAIESERFGGRLAVEDSRRLLKRLTQVETLERLFGGFVTFYPSLYRRHPAETLLRRELKYDFDALPRRSSMANFYLPLSPRTHEKVPRCLLCSPITWANARRAPAAARCKLPERLKAHRL